MTGTRQERREIQKKERKLDKKRSKFAKGMIKGLEIVENLKKMQEAGAIELYNEEYSIYLNCELFWAGKDQVWRANFAKNIQSYFDSINGVEDDHLGKREVELFDIDTGLQLACYHPEKGFVAL